MASDASIRQFGRIGAGAFFVLAVIYAVFVAQIETDFWISLASGRWMAEHHAVTRTDPFTYTFAGKPWWNQNWLSHAAIFGLYAQLGPSGSLIALWIAAAAIFVIVTWRTGARCGSGTAGLLAGGLAAIPCRGYLGPRPAVFGLLCLALVWACLQGLWDDRRPRRWWPAVPLAILLTLWGCLHGSFIYGYAWIGVFVACWLAARLLNSGRPRASDLQIAAVIGAAVVAFGVTWFAGPYGWANFTHPFTVAGSSEWRTVFEWRSPWMRAAYPPVAGFWWVLTLAIIALIAAAAMRNAERVRLARVVDDGPRRASLFEIASLLMMLAMALWARRFIPMLCIVAPEIVAGAVMRFGRAIAPERLGLMRRGVMVGTLAGAAILATVLAYDVRDASRIGSPGSAPNLMAWAVGYEYMPNDGIEFLKRNGLEVNLFTDWVNAAPVMFLDPAVKVFNDGRAQQLFSVEHFRNYRTVISMNPEDADEAGRILDASGTEAILAMPRVARLDGSVDRTMRDSKHWLLALATEDSFVFVRKPSAALDQLGRLLREGRAWWPESARSKATEANILLETQPRDEAGALKLLQEAVAEEPILGRSAYQVMGAIWQRNGRREEALRYFQSEGRRLLGPGVAVDSGVRTQLLGILERCAIAFEPATTGPAK